MLFNAPGSINKLDTQTISYLGEALGMLEKQQQLRGLIVRSTRTAFIVGADITEFLAMFDAPAEHLKEWVSFANSIFNRREDLSVPTVPAINSYALGGRCECPLATDFHVAATDICIGLPEVKLGIILGFRVTVRLPRLLGVDIALELIAAGKEVGATEALKFGLINAIVVVEKLPEAALNIVRQAIHGQLDWRTKRQPKLSH